MDRVQPVSLGRSVFNTLVPAVRLVRQIVIIIVIIVFIKLIKIIFTAIIVNYDVIISISISVITIITVKILSIFVFLTDWFELMVVVRSDITMPITPSVNKLFMLLRNGVRSKKRALNNQNKCNLRKNGEPPFLGTIFQNLD